MSIGLSLAGASLSPIAASSALSGFGGLGFGSLLGSNLLSGLFSGGVSTAGDIFSSRMNYKYNKALQEDAQAHQIYMYQNQNQWRVNDLRKAGLNPILATHAGSAMPSAGMNSVSMPSLGSNFKFDSLIDYLIKAQGFSSAKDLQLFNRENHEVELAQKEADLAIRELTAESILSDIALKTSNSALNMLDVERRSRDWYKRFEDLRDLRNTYKGSTFWQRSIDDAEGYIMRNLLHFNNVNSNSAISIKKRPSKSNFTSYQYRYHRK